MKEHQESRIIVDYKPTEFAKKVTPSAHDYVKGFQSKSNDFRVADIVAEQTGIASLQRSAAEDLVEKEVLSRLKEVEEKAYKEAYDLGLTEGREKAFSDSQQEFSSLLATLKQSVNEIETMKSRLVDLHERHLIELSFALAKRMALDQISSSPDSILKVMKDLSAEIQEDESVTVFLSKKDHEFLHVLDGRSDKILEHFKNCKIEMMESMTPGGCIVKTNFGQIDATIEERVARAWEALSGKLPQEKSDELRSGDGEREGN